MQPNMHLKSKKNAIINDDAIGSTALSHNTDITFTLIPVSHIQIFRNRIVSLGFFSKAVNHVAQCKVFFSINMFLNK